MSSKDLTFGFDARESIGVVGPSGSGKSSLLQLLLRLRPPSSGVVSVDGTDLWDVRAEDWAERVAFVPQEARLLDGTVADNIRFFRDLTDAQVEDAARAAHVHDDVVSWTDGYLTQVGDSGSRLSGVSDSGSR
jgi:ABC-type multidrug transport system fused ATPase/permease subunit